MDQLSINKDDDLYDLRIGESMFSNIPEGGGTHEELILLNHSFRAEIEDYRLKLSQTDQVLLFYKKVLEEEIRK